MNSSVFIGVYRRLSAVNNSRNLIQYSFILNWYKMHSWCKSPEISRIQAKSSQNKFW